MSDIVCVRMNNLETADMNNFGAHGWGEKPYFAVYLCVCVSTRFTFASIISAHSFWAF